MSGANSKSEQTPIAGPNQSNDGVSNEESMVELLPQMFKLNVDCFEEVFQWLSMRDHKHLRLTCVRMKQVVDYFIRLNFPKRKMRIDKINKSQVLYFQPNPDHYGIINHLVLSIRKLTPLQVERMKPILSQIESIEILFSFPQLTIYNEFLKHCTQLKNLRISSNAIPNSSETENAWHRQRYPELKHN